MLGWLLFPPLGITFCVYGTFFGMHFSNTMEAFEYLFEDGAGFQPKSRHIRAQIE